jgi:hypothetical protein
VGLRRRDGCGSRAAAAAAVGVVGVVDGAGTADVAAAAAEALTRGRALKEPLQAARATSCLVWAVVLLLFWFWFRIGGMMRRRWGRDDVCRSCAFGGRARARARPADPRQYE